MRPTRAFAAFVGLGWLLAGCSSDPVSSDAGPCLDCVTISTDAGPGALLDPATPKSVSVADDRLLLLVTFSGGCRVHEFAAVAPPEFTESGVVELPIWIRHDDPDDPCDAIVSEDLSFDLTAVRQLYLATYGVPGFLRLRVHTSPSDEMSVVWDLRAFPAGS
jgi:hypothetical protein